MLTASLVVWILTALFGFSMLVIWIRERGRQQQGSGEIRSALIFTHFGLAASGLILWIVYFIGDASVVGWLAFVLLVTAAVMGFVMFGFWLQQRQSAVRSGADVAALSSTAERRFPAPVVAIHGILAATTIVLVLLVNLGIGESDEESLGLLHVISHIALLM